MATYNYINLAYLETMVGDDDDMKQTMLDMLAAEIPEELANMQAAWAANDLETLFQVSHKMKTTLSYVGNELMIETNKTVEHCARHKVALDDMPALLATLDEQGQLVVAELEALRA